MSGKTVVIIGGLDKDETLALSQILLNNKKSFEVTFDDDSEANNEKPYLVTTGCGDGFFTIDET